MSLTKKAFSWASNPNNTWTQIAVRAVLVMLALPVFFAVDMLLFFARHQETPDAEYLNDWTRNPANEHWFSK